MFASDRNKLDPKSKFHLYSMNFTTVYAGGFTIEFYGYFFFWRYSYFVIDSVLRYIYIYFWIFTVSVKNMIIFFSLNGKRRKKTT